MPVRDAFCSTCGTKDPEPLAYPRTCPGCKPRGLVFGPDGLSEVFAFPLHVEAAQRYFGASGITGSHAFAAY